MTESAAPVAPPARRRRPRRQVVLPIVAVLGVAAVPATDVGSRHAMQRVMAQRMQDQLHTPQRPVVHLDGTPFLTQLISGRFRRVRLEMTDATAGHLRIAHAAAVLTGVRRKSDAVVVDSISGSGLVSYDDLSASVAPLRISAGGAPGQLTVSGGIGPLGFTAAAAPRIDGSTLVVEPVSASATGFGSSGSVDLSSLPPIRLQLRQIPDGLTVGLDPGPDGLRFTFDGHDVALPAAPNS